MTTTGWPDYKVPTVPLRAVQLKKGDFIVDPTGLWHEIVETDHLPCARVAFTTHTGHKRSLDWYDTTEYDVVVMT